METLKQNTIFIILLVLLIGAGIAWYIFYGNDTSEETNFGVVSSNSSQNAVRADILGTVATLRAILLDDSVLDDPAFMSLSETPRPFEGELFEVRRRNPFTP